MKTGKQKLIFILSILLLLLCALASVSYGSKTVSIRSVIGSFFPIGADSFEVSVVRARIPRTVFGLIAGAALGVSGALMQSITRNPIADPSILGVNTGASLFVVTGIAFFQINTGSHYMLLAFAGAGITALFVYGLASTGRGGATPVKLALAGSAANTALQSLVNTVMLPKTQVMDQFRFWQTGSIGGATWDDIILLLPYFFAGFLISLAMASSLNALALGEETAVSLGIRVGLVRALSATAGVLLCASVTALAGPIGFVGLMVPHLVRMLFGPDMRKILPMSAIGGSCLLLLSDVLGRVLGSPGELETGIVTALLGAPVFIFIVRKAKVRTL